MTRPVFIRNLDGEDLLENFLVSSIVSLLGIRFYLQLMHYPTVGGENLHIAHMLWGGLFMLVSIILLLSFFSKSVMRLAAVIGGIGFGTFIDELGKFITSDNNYFYQPTIALIYVIFVVLYLFTRFFPKFRQISSTEYLINAVEMTKEAIINDLDHEEKELALTYIKKSNQNSPITKTLTRLLKEFDSIPPPQPSIFSTVRRVGSTMYYYLLSSKWFLRGIVVSILVGALMSLISSFFFIAQLNKYLFGVLVILFISLSFYYTRSYRNALKALVYTCLLSIFVSVLIFSAVDKSLTILSFDEWGRVLFSGISSFFAVKGLYQVNLSRLKAYQSFKLSLLISIFLTQFFVFYQLQFFALIGFGINILMLLTVQYMITKETQQTPLTT